MTAMTAMTTGMTAVDTLVLAQADAAATVSTGEAIAFWILGPLALAGALGMVFARNAVHSALWLVLTMLSLGMLYLAQQAQFLGFADHRLHRRDHDAVPVRADVGGPRIVDSVVEVLRGQRLMAGLVRVGVAGLLAAASPGDRDVTPAPLLDPWA